MPEATTEARGGGGSAGDVADRLTGVMRSYLRARDRYQVTHPGPLEWSATSLLKVIACDGPLRHTQLADTLHLDPSTVSRQVAHLVKEGYVSRRADQDDGRASVLEATERGHALLADHYRRRQDFFAGVMRDWPAADIADFARLLETFDADFARAVAERVDQPVTATR